MHIFRSIVVFVTTSFLTSSIQAQESGIINNNGSPYVKLKSINIGDCQWTHGFWADKLKLAAETMVPYMGEVLKGDVGHAYNNFKIATGMKEGTHKGFAWHDGDFYKWMEASTYIYANNKNQEILKELDVIIDVIEKAMHEDGYISTFVDIKGKKRFEQKKHHELYNSGHLMTSACIHNRITGKTNFLKLAKRNADYLYKTFQSRPDSLARFGQNPSQIMGLVELFRTTKNKKYLDLAVTFLDMRGTNLENGLDKINPMDKGDFTQDKKPFRKESEAVGHAVMAMYLYNGAADIYAETGDKHILKTLNKLKKDIPLKTYITGAVGQTHHGVSQRSRGMVHEAFIEKYVMPNTTAYNETCANIANAMFNWRMMAINANSSHADVMETVLFNSALSGISIKGTEYFYTNPLRRTIHSHIGITDHKTRVPYIKCFCCPPNLVRTIAKSSAWAYSKADNGITINLYGGNKLSTTLLDGSTLQLTQETLYPWEGLVQITIQECKKEAFDMMLRIPKWAEGYKVKVNGKIIDTKTIPGNFVQINRKWNSGDIITLDMPMDIKTIQGNPLIEETRNQVAVTRGPVVYCAETADFPVETDILDVYYPFKTRLQAVYKPKLLGGVTTLVGKLKLRKDTSKEMYQEVKAPKWEFTKTQLIPYFSWSNRGISEMTVWMPVDWE